MDKSFDPTPQKLAKLAREGRYARGVLLGRGGHIFSAMIGFLVGSYLLWGEEGLGDLRRLWMGQTYESICEIRSLAVSAAGLVGLTLFFGFLGGLSIEIVQAGGVKFVLPWGREKKGASWFSLKPLFGRIKEFPFQLGWVSCLLMVNLVISWSIWSSKVAWNIEIGGELDERIEAGRLFLSPAIFGLIAVMMFVLTVAGLEWLIAWFRFRKRNRMSLKEVREELKESEGDPQIKQQRRLLHRDMVQREFSAAELSRRVKEAKFIVLG